jgi:exopolysaccharide biosynthesis polyprenyl glycosylphosphotransferase
VVLQQTDELERIRSAGNGVGPAPSVRAVPVPIRVGDVEHPIAEGATRRLVMRREARYRRALALADIASAAVAVALGIQVLGDDRLKLTALAALPLVVLVSKLIGLYDRDENLLRKTTLDETPAIFQVATLYTLLIWFADSLLVGRAGFLGRGQMLAVWSLLFLLMLGGRAAARRYVRRSIAAERCLVVGSALAARGIERKFKMSPSLKAVVVGRVPIIANEINGAAPSILGEFDSLDRLLVEYDVHRVVVAPETTDSDEILDVIRRVKQTGVKVSVLPRLFEVVGSSVEMDDIDGLTLLGVHRYGLTKSSEILKRGMDVTGAALGLLLLSPILFAIGTAIKLTSPGPVLFRQRRIGPNGEFGLLKFRTMVDGADGLKPDLIELNEGADGFFKIAEDPRITQVGRFLRRSCLDELPQLVNVLRGEMSLVGPRPLVPEEDRRIEGWQRTRLQLKPGMTGHWQIFGSSRIPLREMVKIDYLYGANWSLWVDTKILLRTVPYVLRRAGL